MAQVTRYATGASGTSWTTPSNANADDGAYASYSISGKNSTGNECTLSNFGFDTALPATVEYVINSVTIEVEHRVSFGAEPIAHIEVAINRAGTTGTWNTDSTEPTTDTQRSYTVNRPGGGSWTRNDLLNGTLTVRLRARSGNDADPFTVYWDYARVLVDYTVVTHQLVQSGSTAISGALGVSGDLVFGVPFAVVQLGSTEISGTLALSGDIEYPLPAGFRGLYPWLTVNASNVVFDLAQSSPIAVAGTLGISGDVDHNYHPFDIAQSGTTDLAGALAVSGDVAYTIPHDVAQSGAIGIAGTLTTAGDLAYPLGSIDLAQTGEIGISGTVGVAGTVGFSYYNFAAANAVGISGTIGISGDIGYGTTFAWRSYRPWLGIDSWTEDPFPIEAVSPIGISGTLGVSASSLFIRIPHAITQSGSTDIAGTLTIAGDVHTDATAVPHALVQSGSVDLLGGLGVSGQLTSTIPYEFEPGLPLEINLGGALAVSGAVGITRPHDILRLAPLAMSGTLSVAGNIGLTIPAGTPHALVQSGTIDLSGTLGVSAALVYGVRFTLAAAAPIGLNGTFTITGDTRAAPFTWALAQSGTLDIGGAMTVDGNIGIPVVLTFAPTAPLAISGAVGFNQAELGMYEPQAPGPGGLPGVRRRRRK